jgi:hypothetical protein
LDSLRPLTASSHEEHVKELTEIKASYDEQKVSGSQLSWLDLFKKVNLKRTLTIVIVQALQ